MKTTFIIATLLIGLVGSANSQQMNYQGRLTDNTGSARPGPQADLSFSLWTAPNGGTKVWGDFALAADLIDGRFSVKLGDAAGNDGNDRFLSGAFGGPRFLQIQVGADAPLPRQEVLPAPVALHAVNAEELLADDRKLSVQSAPSLPGGPSNFQPDAGQAGWLMEYLDSTNGNHAGLFMNGNTVAMYSSGTNGLLNIYDEDELSEPSPSGPRFRVDANGGVVSSGGGTFVGNLDVGGFTEIDGFNSDGPATINGITSITGDATMTGNVVIRDKGPVDLEEDGARYPFQITGLRYPRRPLTDPGNGNQRLISYQMDNDDNGTFLDNSIGVGLIVHWGTAFKAGGGSWATTSDRRLKKNIEDLRGSLDRLEQLRPVTFRYRNERRHGVSGTQIGFIAQEVEEVFPAWVGRMNNTEPLLSGEEVEPDRVKTVGITGFEALAVGALRELREEKDLQLAELKNSTNLKISGLEAQNAELRARLSRLEERLGKLGAPRENFQDSPTAQR